MKDKNNQSPDLIRVRTVKLTDESYEKRLK